MKQMKIRYTEAFYSVQGEGKYVGVPSVFLRLFGCNFKCKGFGMPKGIDSQEYLNIDATQYNSFNELPLVNTGCDSYASWAPSFKKFACDSDIDEVVNKLVELTPTGEWTLANGQDIHLILTGGEPLLGWQRAYSDLFNHPKMKGLKNVTFETNGTQKLTDAFKKFIESNTDITITFSCSPKLSISGEEWSEAIVPAVVKEYDELGNLYFKFVVETQEDLTEVAAAVGEYQTVGDIHCPVYIMPVGGCKEKYQGNTLAVANMAMEYGWRYTPRLHVDIFGNSWGT
jgi:organic radical activating enzyme